MYLGNGSGRLWLSVVIGSFFFQAEDGIRDLTVTGVQTCALPICRREARALDERSGLALNDPVRDFHHHPGCACGGGMVHEQAVEVEQLRQRAAERSEERRVGKEGRSRWSPDH